MKALFSIKETHPPSSYDILNERIDSRSLDMLKYVDGQQLLNIPILDALEGHTTIYYSLICDLNCDKVFLMNSKQTIAYMLQPTDYAHEVASEPPTADINKYRKKIVIDEKKDYFYICDVMLITFTWKDNLKSVFKFVKSEQYVGDRVEHDRSYKLEHIKTDVPINIGIFKKPFRNAIERYFNKSDDVYITLSLKTFW